jgi:hypothetical protein
MGNLLDTDKVRDDAIYDILNVHNKWMDLHNENPDGLHRAYITSGSTMGTDTLVVPAKFMVEFCNKLLEHYGYEEEDEIPSS